MKKYFFLLAFVIISLGSLGGISFERTIAISTQEQLPGDYVKCNTAITTAQIEAKNRYISKTNEFFALQKYSGVAKAQSIDIYDRTYTCMLKAICEASKPKHTSEILLKNSITCKPITRKELETRLNADFKSCQNMEIQFTEQELWSRCETLINTNVESSRVTIAQNFQQAVSVENRGNLGAKILDIQKRMAILREKTRKFTYNFMKVINDIGCTIAGKSFR